MLYEDRSVNQIPFKENVSENVQDNDENPSEKNITDNVTDRGALDRRQKKKNVIKVKRCCLGCSKTRMASIETGKRSCLSSAI